jgi:hypothetical protein
MADTQPIPGIRYNAQVNHPRNRLTVRDWQLLGRALDMLLQQPIKDLQAGALPDGDTMHTLQQGDCVNLRRKMGVHMGVAMVEEYDAIFPDERRGQGIRLSADMNSITVLGQTLQLGNTYAISDPTHLCHGYSGTLRSFKYAGSTGNVMFNDGSGNIITAEVPLAALREVRT